MNDFKFFCSGAGPAESRASYQRAGWLTEMKVRRMTNGTV
jgi:hypothetical protein